MKTLKYLLLVILLIITLCLPVENIFSQYFQDTILFKNSTPSMNRFCRLFWKGEYEIRYEIINGWRDLRPEYYITDYSGNNLFAVSFFLPLGTSRVDNFYFSDTTLCLIYTKSWDSTRIVIRKLPYQIKL